jgi:pimeloyl-ACP methyl ester carboxylesterase
MWTASRSRPEVVKELEAITRRNLAPFRMTFAPYLPVAPPAMERLSAVSVPTLVVIGDKDTPGLRQVAELMAKQIPGATMKMVEGADHGLPIGWADQFNAVVMAFISARKTP